MTPWQIYMTKPRLEYQPGSPQPSCGLVQALIAGECEIEDHGKSKGVNEGYPTFKVSVKATGRSWETYRLASQAAVDTLIDWIIGIPGSDVRRVVHPKNR